MRHVGTKRNNKKFNNNIKEKKNIYEFYNKHHDRCWIPFTLLFIALTVITGIQRIQVSPHHDGQLLVGHMTDDFYHNDGHMTPLSKQCFMPMDQIRL